MDRKLLDVKDDTCPLHRKRSPCLSDTDVHDNTAMRKSKQNSQMKFNQFANENYIDKILETWYNYYSKGNTKGANNYV